MSVFYQLSESQKSIWYLEKAYPGASLNIVAGNMRLKGDVCYPALERTVNILVKKNDSMRLRIREIDGAAVQYISEYKEFKVDFLDFSKSGGLKDLFLWDEAKTRTPLNIIENDLYYIAIYKISDEEGGIYVKMHHLISDAWTFGLVASQIVEFYTKLKNGQPVDESPNPSFVEHLRSEMEYEKSPRFEKDKKYWLEKFETLPEMTVLKPLKASENSINARRKTLITPLKLSNKIREFCKANNVSVFTLFMSALAIYINRVTGIEDIILGTTILNRTNQTEKETTGMFVSVAAPVRISINDTSDFKTFTKTMLKENTDVLRHQKYPYNYLLKDLKKKHKFPNRLFDIVLSYQNSKYQDETDTDFTTKWIFPGCQVESLIISINDRENSGNLIIDYDFLTDVFDIKEIEFIHQHIISLLWHALDNPTRSISRLEMISEKEKHLILHDFNNTYAEYPRDKTIHRMFEEQVERTPQSTALLFNGAVMTYAELNEKANRLANTLRLKGVGPDKIVGLLSHRSFEMIVGIMAVLKAGGAYMPIDPAYPAERQRYMLDNSRAGLLLAQRSLLNAALFDGEIIDLDDASSYTGDGENLPAANSSGDLAYVIYTSGSTGNPKGVMIQHSGVVNSFCWGVKKFSLDAGSMILQKTAPTFDPSVWEIFWWLMLGGKVCLIESGDEKDPEAIISAIEKYQVTAMHFVPSMMNLFLHYVEVTSSVGRLASLKQVFSCGEAINIIQVEEFNRILYTANGTRLYNMYGPTEATVEVACFDCSPEPLMNTVPIGQRIDNFNIYILDKNRNILPVGIPGEIYISGAGVGRGYLNSPELTAERFVRNPFVHGEKMYRTGDRARWYPKGDIEFLGRMDFQVKIKGFRIELGEIEEKLLKHESVLEAAVKPCTESGGNTYLAAYVVLKDDISSDALRAYLTGLLPDYMVPGCFVVLDKMPLNNNGKTDRNALPAPRADAFATSEYTPPVDETEAVITDIWCKALGLERVGVLDEYSAVGGDSLSAIKIITEIHKSFGVELSPKAVFQLQTIRKLAAHIASVRGQKSSYLEIPKIPSDAFYPVSAAQKRQYILNQIDGGVSYNLPGGLVIKGKIDAVRLENVFKTIIRRHEALRTSFHMRDGLPVQVIHDTVDFRVEYREAGEADDDMLMEAFVRPFDLGVAPLIRVGLVKMADNRHVLLFDMHHIISDGASVNVIIKEFTELYNGGDLPELRIQYKDYSSWHNAMLRSDKMKGQEAYWLDKFSGELPVLNMPLDFVRPSYQSFRGDKLHFTIDQKLTKAIRALNARTGTTLFMFLLSSYNVLLSRYTGQEDIVIGTPVEGRRHADLRGLVGMFVNTLAIRSNPAGDKTFGAFLSEVRDDLLNAYDNQEYPFEALVEKAGVRRDMSRNPLFDTTFVLQNMDLTKLAVGSFSAVPYTYNNKTSKFDLALEAVDKGDVLECSFEYCTDLFREDTVQRLSEHFINAIADILANPEKKLCDVNLLSEEERTRLLYAFNETDADYPRDKTIQQVFEERAAAAPDSVALVFKDAAMTYGELNERANRLARTLRARGVCPDDIVGLIMGRSFEMIVAILAVIKAGGAYMPIDPDYPAERKAYMLEDSGAKVLLTKRELMGDVAFNGTVLDPCDETAYAPDATNPNIVNKPSDLAYIIYTSGSTGRPKGVMIEHRNVVGLFCNEKFQFDFSCADVWTLFHSYCFDFTVWEMYGALLFGGKLIVIPSEVAKDPELYLKTLVSKKVTVLCQTPQAMYNLVNDEADSDKKELSLRYVFLGGEALKPALLLPLRDRYPSTEFVNLYGPTESTIFVTSKVLGPDDYYTGISNIGSAIPMAKIYVADQRLNLVPFGIPGELYISGNGISRGYINNEPLTHEHFLRSPFAANDVLYKTGDLVRLMTTGDIEYLGRTDGQVKIRGYRIELGEIESQLLTVAGIKETKVVVKNNRHGDKLLCAYYISETTYQPNELREWLSKKIPAYMIPSFFIALDVFPLNISGKVDTKSLPEPYEELSRTESEMPGSHNEIMLADIWSGVLGINRIGISENFFELGGNSLNAVTIATQIHKNMMIEVGPREIFLNPTIKELAAIIEAMPKSVYAEIPRVSQGEYYPVSSAQKRQYILNNIDGGINYNIPYGVMITGRVDNEKIEQTFNKIISRHEALRTSFEMRDGQLVQIVHDASVFHMEFIDAESADDDGLMEAFVRPFDLSVAPLFRVRLVTFSEEKHALLFDMHHIISDGASINIIAREFAALYSGAELPELKVQYKDYSAWHNALLQTERLKNQEAYWLGKFSGELPVLNMPLDFVRPSVQSFAGNRLNFTIDRKLTGRIRDIVTRTGTTLFMFLLSSYTILLSKYTGQEDIVIGTPVEGRRHADLRDLVGMFVNTLAIRSCPAGEKTFEAFLYEVKEDLLSAYDNQEYPFEALVEKACVRRDTGRNPLFDAAFALQNLEMTALAAGGFTATPYVYTNKTSKFDLMLEAFDQGETIECSLEYCTDLFAEETIRRLAGHFINALNSITENPKKKLSELSLLSDAERRQLLCEYNDTAAGYPRDKTIQQMLEEQAARTPDSTAVIFQGGRMTYRELNEKANRLARTLRAKGVGPGKPVGIMTYRSPEMLIGIFGILKAGGAYVPIDPDYPADRKKYILETSGAAVLLTQSEQAGAAGLPCPALNLDDSSSYSDSRADLTPVNTPDDLAYMIFTSGSTGKPKGVMIRHASVINRLNWMQRCYPLTAESVILQKTTYTFDVSVWELFWWSFAGASVCLLQPGGEKSPEAILDAVSRFRVTVMHFVPSMLGVFLDYIEAKSGCQRLSTLSTVFASGEALTLSHVERFNRLLYETNGTKLTNLYGPTEATVDVSSFDCSPMPPRRSVPIGRPIDNIRLYILDRYERPVPVGVYGELFIGGVGVAVGYINNAALTDERFLPNPFAPGEKYYKTGDMVRWNTSGEIEFSGRMDFQVKLRGFRIELGEVENRMLQFTGIKEAAVIGREDNSGLAQLCAYFTADHNIELGALKKYLMDFLPDYMIPQHYVRLEKMPYSGSGKLDRKQIPQLGEQLKPSLHRAPETETQQQIAAVWEEVLGVKGVGPDDNFFELGGNSLSAIKVLLKISSNASITDLYRFPVLSEFAEQVSGGASAENGLLLRLSKCQKAKTSVICFPYGGGNAYAFKELSNSLDNKAIDYALYAVNLPGHDMNSSRELESVETLAAEVVEEIKENITGEIILYSHCVGCALLIETARRLERDHVKLKSIFVGGIFPPRFIGLYGRFYKPWLRDSDETIKSFLLEIGMPAEAFDNEQYTKTLFRAFRHDSQGFAEYFYRHRRPDRKLETPVNCVVGDIDTTTKNYKSKYRLWDKYAEKVRLIVLKNAKHYFVNTHADALADYFSGAE